MKNLIYLLVAALFSLSAVSCGTYAYSQEVYDNEVVVSNDNVSIIITQGTPVYYEGHLHYYIYNNLYWYPFWYENYWYFRPYRTIYPWGYDFHFRPHHSDYRFRPGHHGFRRPDHSRGHYGLPREGHTYDNHNGRRPNAKDGRRPNSDNRSVVKGDGRRYGDVNSHQDHNFRQQPATRPNRPATSVERSTHSTRSIQQRTASPSQHSGVRSHGSRVNIGSRRH